MNLNDRKFLNMERYILFYSLYKKKMKVKKLKSDNKKKQKRSYTDNHF